ncbi:hypothetical protein IAQ61_011761 [Plenodomus lingam]|uniref:uncharacterized protein n=1 Tax=Leptosphaeria maculans TaxID=5022 RepID=UPI00331C96A7|nr:hypothetical protein IAQ61_011761 [Plenodomus lingam]
MPAAAQSRSHAAIRIIEGESLGVPNRAFSSGACNVVDAVPTPIIKRPRRKKHEPYNDTSLSFVPTWWPPGPNSVSRPRWLQGSLASLPLSSSPTHEEDEYCQRFPDPGNIAIAVKTGATEAAEKIPMLMRTPLRCAHNVVIYSDLEQEIAGYKLHDSLADIPESAMEGNSDFDFYKKLKEVQKYGQIESMLKQMKNPRSSKELAAWTLDKYKQLHILEKLYAAHPHKDWYLMVDADTYLVWPNLLTWLAQLAPASSTKLYFGSPAYVGDIPFAHGGSGILISHATMYDFAVTHKGLAGRWDRAMQEHCCGDFVIGAVLRSNGIPLTPAWPTINGEKPSTLPFGPTHWCQPVVTMHHVQPNELNQLANFEQARNNTRTPLTFAELYDNFVKDILPDTLADWYSQSRDARFAPVDTYEECRKLCEGNEECFQFMHHGNECDLGYSIHLGMYKEAENGVAFRSGWLTDRIRRWVEEQSPCEPVFPSASDEPLPL